MDTPNGTLLLFDISSQGKSSENKRSAERVSARGPKSVCAKANPWSTHTVSEFDAGQMKGYPTNV
jgi:hypothetical protein